MEVRAVDALELELVVGEEERLVVVDFWAEWCGHCRALLSVLERLASERADAIAVVKVDIDANRELAFEQGIQAAPTLLFYRDGEVVDRAVGFAGRAALARRIDALCEPEPSRLTWG